MVYIQQSNNAMGLELPAATLLDFKATANKLYQSCITSVHSIHFCFVNLGI